MTAAMDCAMSVEGSGPPLILVHGIGAARDTWRFAMAPLAERFTVISYDLRGHGASPMPALPFGLDEMVADLERVRERAGVESAHIAGHSLGGMIGPALIFVAFNFGNKETIAGWGIPMATDIAFAVGILAMLGSRIPNSLKV